MAKKAGRVFVISSPSGGGKTTICKRLKRDRFDIRYSVSATTREPRPGEKNGRDYYFLKKSEFERLIKKKGFLEWTHNFGDLYGTPKNFVMKTVSKGKDVILSIDVKGATQIKKLYKDAVLIFVSPPSMKVWKRRLRKRRTETRDVLRHRLRVAKRELAYLKRYDYNIVNDSLKEAADALKSIIIAERNRVKR
jgi:guanylate kinase